MGKSFSCISKQGEKVFSPEVVPKKPSTVGKRLKNTFFGGKYSPSVGIAFPDSEVGDLSSKIDVSHLFLASSFKVEKPTHEEDASVSKSLTELAREFISNSRSDTSLSSSISDVNNVVQTAADVIVDKTKADSKKDTKSIDSSDSLTAQYDEHLDHSDVIDDVTNQETAVTETSCVDTENIAELNVDKSEDYHGESDVVTVDKTLSSMPQTCQFVGTERKEEFSSTDNKKIVPQTVESHSVEKPNQASRINIIEVKAMCGLDEGGGIENKDGEGSPVSQTCQLADTKEVITSPVNRSDVHRYKKSRESLNTKLLDVNLHNKIGVLMKEMVEKGSRLQAIRNSKTPSSTPVPLPPTDHSLLRKEISLLPLVNPAQDTEDFTQPVQVHPNDVLRLACLSFMRSLTPQSPTCSDNKLSRAVSVPVIPDTSTSDNKELDVETNDITLCRSAMSTPNLTSSAMKIIKEKISKETTRSDSTRQTTPVFKKVSDFPAPKVKRNSAPLSLHLPKIQPKHMYSIPNVARTDIKDSTDICWKQVDSKSPKAQMPWICRSPRFDVVFPPLGERLFKRVGSIKSLQQRRIIPQVKNIEIIKLENDAFPGLRVYKLRKGRHKYSFELPRHDNDDDDEDEEEEDVR